MAPALQWFGITGLYLTSAVLSALGAVLVPFIPEPRTGNEPAPEKA